MITQYATLTLLQMDVGGVISQAPTAIGLVILIALVGIDFRGGILGEMREVKRNQTALMDRLAKGDLRFERHDQRIRAIEKAFRMRQLGRRQYDALPLPPIDEGEGPEEL